MQLIAILYCNIFRSYSMANNVWGFRFCNFVTVLTEHGSIDVKGCMNIGRNGSIDSVMCYFLFFCRFLLFLHKTRLILCLPPSKNWWHNLTNSFTRTWPLHASQVYRKKIDAYISELFSPPILLNSTIAFFLSFWVILLALLSNTCWLSFDFVWRNFMEDMFIRALRNLKGKGIAHCVVGSCSEDHPYRWLVSPCRHNEGHEARLGWLGCW